MKRYSAPKAPFARKYTSANEDVCGPAIVHLFRRALHEYGDQRYLRLATLSPSHLYNVRKSASYQAQRRSLAKTRPVCNPIGVRRVPRPNGRAGYVRIDTVHQGDLDGVKGVYHITCVDAVCLWQVEACVQGISEAFLLPVQALIVAQFPFEIVGFHSDNGSEYINKQVSALFETPSGSYLNWKIVGCWHRFPRVDGSHFGFPQNRPDPRGGIGKKPSVSRA